MALIALNLVSARFHVNILTVSSRKKQIRKNFRDVVFKRDGYKCMFCDIHQDLDAHHITDRILMPNGGYVLENGITLCPEHHLIAETWHISKHQEWVDGFHPDELYLKINSSYQKAVKVLNEYS